MTTRKEGSDKGIARLNARYPTLPLRVEGGHPVFVLQATDAVE
ncbi:MAG TPA: hypothetical protein VFA99_02720 [Acidobacteriaceae bacterium]|nr:hypothetical protein [Acidobacteriaceae bacterium]